MEKKEPNKVALIITFSMSIIILITIVVVGTYSLYTSGISQTNKGNENSTVKSAKIEYSLTDGTLSGENLLPGDTVTKTFQVNNTGTVDGIFQILWKSVVNNFVNQDDLIVTLKEDETEIITAEDNITLPTTSTDSTILIDELTIEAGKTKNYTLTITYKDTEENQIDDMGKDFSAVIELKD